MAIHHRVSDYARAMISRAYKVVKVENPFATGLDDIQRSLSSFETQTLNWPGQCAIWQLWSSI